MGYKVIPSTPRAAKDYGFSSEHTVQVKTRSGTVHFNLQDHGQFAMVLMPVRAFSTARAAEVTAQRRIESAFARLDPLKVEIAKEGTVNPLLDELATAHKDGKVVLRTYLTSADGYRRHIADGTACNDLKEVLLPMHLPHFTWVTEISTVDSYNNSSAGLRRIFGHTVLDATSSGRDVAGLLMLHLPGVVFLRNVNAPPENAETAVLIDDDRLYECREKRQS